MTSEKKQVAWKIFTGVCVSLLVALVMWIVGSVIKENTIYGQMRETPEKVNKLELKTNKVLNKTDSMTNVFVTHNAVQVEQVTEINKKIDKLGEKIDKLIELELAKK